MLAHTNTERIILTTITYYVVNVSSTFIYKHIAYVHTVKDAYDTLLV